MKKKKKKKNSQREYEMPTRERKENETVGLIF